MKKYTEEEVKKIKLLSYQKGYQAGKKKGQDIINGVGYQIKLNK